MPKRNSQRLVRSGSLGQTFVTASPSLILEIDERTEKFALDIRGALITGENGTGKDTLARHLHAASVRSGRAMVTVDCTAIPQDLVESELFGHVRGAFTGAINNRAGKFKAADHGILLLGEVGELPLTAQAKLLRVLEEMQFEAVGSNRTIDVDVRVIATTNRDLEQMVSEGKFRQDLYFRLRRQRVRLPPLRERREDILFLAEAYLETWRLDGAKLVLGEQAKQLLLSEHQLWPGNVRQLIETLNDALESATLRSDSKITRHDFHQDDDPVFGLASSGVVVAVDDEELEETELVPSSSLLDRVAQELARGHYSRKQVWCAFTRVAFARAGNSLEEAAGILGIPKSTAKNRRTKFLHHDIGTDHELQQIVAQLVGKHSYEELDPAHIREALRECDYVRQIAAKNLGVNPATLSRLKELHGIHGRFQNAALEQVV